jgi:serine/threonine-protein kinase
MDHQKGQPSVTEADSATRKAERSPDMSGQTLGDFQILRKLGEGGMGQVYLAQQMSLKRKVALKLLRADLAANATALKRFRAEAEAVAQATHPNIVQVYDIQNVNDLYYMALEYVEGRNLRQFLEKKGPPEVLLSLSIIRQVAAALQRAAELGIVHRDIKPENILLTRRGEVKVADFGLSRFFGDEATQALHLTQSGITLGTPLYMSPEQVEGKAVDPRTDIYSFGVTCYHLLSGNPPFRGKSAFDVAVQHVQKQPVPLTQIRPDLPAELCSLVHRMMAKKPEERIQTGREIVREVARLRDTLVASGALNANAVTAQPVGTSGDSGQQTAVVHVGPSGPDALFDATLTQSVPRLGRLPWKWIISIAAAATIFMALAGGLLAGWLWSRGQSGPSQAYSAPVEVPPVPLATTPGVSTEEKRLLDIIQNVEAGHDVAEALKYRTDLGLYYLKEWRLKEAEKTFKAIEDLDKERPNKDYNGCGLLGKAMVLAFRDDARASNKLFEKLLVFKAKVKPLMVVHPLLRNRPEMAEMVARALNHNLANLPNEFPQTLRMYLAPPAAKVKPAEPTGGSK